MSSDVCNNIKGFNWEVIFSKPFPHPDGEFVRFGDKHRDGQIFVGGVDSINPSIVEKEGFTHIIHCHVDSSMEEIEGVEELWFEGWIDEPFQYAISYFEPAFKFLDSAFEKNKDAKVLIHCHGGVSRSATICAAYLCRLYKWSLDQVIMVIRKSRWRTFKNQSFTIELEMFIWNDFKVDEVLYKMSELHCEEKDFRYDWDKGKFEEYKAKAIKLLSTKNEGEDDGEEEEN